MVNGRLPRIAITPGEPAGIGPDLIAALATQDWPAELVIIGDKSLLAERAGQPGADLQLENYTADREPAASIAGHLKALHIDLSAPVTAGDLNPANSPYVLDTIRRACDGCMTGEFAAMVTGPVHKGVINEGGIAFSGHTEFLAERCGASLPVMLLVAGTLRVALVTTHLPLRRVADAINPSHLTATIRILDEGLRNSFGIATPRIAVLGLNPHAGESGYLGQEEQEIIEPVLALLREEGLHLEGPLPADTAFTEHHLSEVDAVLAMYHDQGLPVLKHRGFGRSVNVTLGLPIVRTSVDHGTALDLAGTAQADAGSLHAALSLAIKLGTQRRP
jgi:4-hydroxythreonine-4-phosphate dehydrogenase